MVKYQNMFIRILRDRLSYRVSLDCFLMTFGPFWR